MRIFISYQTKKTAKVSKTIEKRLRKAFRIAHIFRASSRDGGIPTTDDWLKTLRTELLASDFFVIIVDKDWLRNVRTGNPSYVRLETEIALVRSAGTRLYFFPVKGDPGVGEELGKVPRLNKPTKTKVPRLLQECFEKQWPLELNFESLFKDLVKTLRAKWTEIFQPQRLPILFVGSTFSVEGESNDFLDYFGHVAGEVARTFSNTENRGQLTLDCIVKLPTTKDTLKTQLALLNEAETWSKFYRAVIIAPFQTRETYPRVVALMKSKPYLPVFTIDKSYEELAKQDNRLPPLGVMNNWTIGGGLAAEAAVSHLKTVLHIEVPRVLLVSGLEGSNQRIEAFKAYLSERLNNAQIVDVLQGNFQKSVARGVVSNFLNSMAQNEVLHLIFCTNDEMAIGAREAVIIWERKVIQRRSGIVVIGYDAIDSVTDLIEADDPYLLNTVDVEVREQVRKLSLMLVNYILNEETEPSERVPKTNGRLVRKFDKQREFTVQWAKWLRESAFNFPAFGVAIETIDGLS